MNRPNNRRKPRFREMLYKGGGISERDMTEAEMLAIDPHDVDFHFNEATGQICIRKEDGTYIEHLAVIPGVGAKGERLLTEMMWNYGQLIMPRQVATLLGKSSRYQQDEFHNSISALLSRLRGAFGEKTERGQKPSPWFFLSRRRPFSFGWNPARTWRVIERIAEAESSDEGKDIS